jgi:hypothetical protein
MSPSGHAVRPGVFAVLCAWSLAAGGAAPGHHDPDEQRWIELFNGRDLSGWTPKITGHELGDNYADTFRVEDGLLKVSYDGYQHFESRFGHLFYQTPFSYYRLAIEYRFVGEQAPGNPGDWAVKNSGVMIHAQDPATMTLDQSFPLSVEAQFLGGLGDGNARPTANVCTPGTEIIYGGRIHPEHCLNSASATLDGWVQVELIVLGAGLITHRVNGETVLSYALPQTGGAGAETLPQERQHELLEGGYIALQSESHPIEFRKVSLLDLEGCMDPDAANYKSYYVKSRADACRHATAR